MKPATLKNPAWKHKLASLALAGLLPLAAQAHDAGVRRDTPVRVSGTVNVAHEIPGGVITVGVQWGQRPQPKPQVVIVKNRQPDVVVIEKNRGRGHEENRRLELSRKHKREVTVIREEPRREADFRSHIWSDGRQVSIDRQGPAGNYHYYSDGRQVSEDRQGPVGNYHYYEDEHQVSIDDNRDGQQKHVYIRK